MLGISPRVVVWAMIVAYAANEVIVRPMLVSVVEECGLLSCRRDSFQRIVARINPHRSNFILSGLYFKFLMQAAVSKLLHQWLVGDAIVEI